MCSWGSTVRRRPSTRSTRLSGFSVIVSVALMLTAVVDYDVAVGSGLAEERDRAETDLRRAAEATGLAPEAIVLSGRPAEALSKQAVEEGYELTAVGRGGRGASRTSWAALRPS